MILPIILLINTFIRGTTLYNKRFVKLYSNPINRLLKLAVKYAWLFDGG